MRGPAETDEWHDDDWDSQDEDPDVEDDSTMACPFCNREIHEDSERCPHCERYLSREDRPVAPKPWWIILGVVLCLYAIFRWIF